MTKKEAIESIKNATKAISKLFFVEEFEAVKVKDGSQDVSIEGEYTKGTKVSVSSSTGSVPAPDGKYTLANGQCFSTKGGVIDEIMDSDTEEFSAEETKTEEAIADEIKSDEPVAEDIKPEEVKAEEPVAEENAEVKALTEKVEELESAFKSLKEAFATKEDMKSLGEAFSSIQKAFEVLSDTPAEFSKVDSSVLAKEDKSRKIEALAGLKWK